MSRSTDGPASAPHVAPHPAAERLLAELAPLPHPARLRHLARAAHALAGRGELAAVLAVLAGRGRYERRLGALAALTGGQTPYLAARLADPDDVVRRYALRAVRCLPVPDGAVEAAYEGASGVVRRELSRAVVAAGRRELAERLVGTVRERWGDGEAVRLLPACPPEFAARVLPELAHAVRHWGPLGRYQPQAVVGYAERVLAGLPRNLRRDWWTQHAHGLAAAAPAEPLRVLGLLERYGPALLPGALRDGLATLAAADAERVVRRLTSPEWHRSRYGPRPSPALVRALVQADPPSLPVLGREWLAHPEHLAALLRAMPPHRREAFFDTVTAGAPLEWTAAAAPLLAALPRDRRAAVARELVARGRAEEWWIGDVLGALAHLPVAEARPGLLTAVRSSDPEDRATAWPYLVANAGHARDHAALSEVLVLMDARLGNERDPIRAQALKALAAVPGAPFTAGDVGLLDRIALAAVQARDCSWATRNALRDLALGVLRHHTAAGEPELLDWAARTLGRLAGRTGGVDLGGLVHTLRRGQEGLVVAALEPWLRAGADHGEYGLLFALHGALGRRAYRLPELQELLGEALRKGDDDAFRAAARRWLADPATRAERVAELLASEPSAAVLPAVGEALAARRTDLLDALLAEEPPYGRFLPGRARRPLPDFRYADRWLPRQQEAAARLARDAAGDDSRPLAERAAAVTSAAAVPEQGRALALDFAASGEVLLAEAALAALARTDEPAEDLAVLLAHAGGDRARVAVYAADRVAARTPAAALSRPLGALLTATTGAKVTSRKEAARLTARHLPPAEAVGLLATAYRTPRQHPDVRAAVVRCVPGLLAAGPRAAAGVWELLDEAVGSDAPAVRQALQAARPLDLPAAHRPRYAGLLAGLAEDADHDVADNALSALEVWAAYAPQAADAVRRIATDLTRSRSGWHRAAGVIGTLAGSGLPHPVGGGAPGSLLHRTVTELLGVVRGGEPEDEADRDLPAFRRLHHLVTMAVSGPEALAAVAGLLADEPDLLPARLSAMTRALDVRADLPELVAALRALAAALDGHPALAAATATHLCNLHAYNRSRGVDEATMLEAVRRLSAGDGLAEGLLATGLAEAFGPAFHWPQGWRSALRTLRAHPVSDVRHVARRVAIVAE
ncbi:hypothetical protein OG535_36780 [Kitasatospora sp. NBC_00085]|uniref:hypothetical protein n=1 Tax=unclassified Kitasatospora TaxID=2633591 RepID=UPI0032506960